MSKENIGIRLATAADAPAVASIYAYYVNETVITFEDVSPSADEMSQRISKASQRHAFLVAERGDEIVAYAYTMSHRERAAYNWCINASIYLKLGWTGQGIGTTLYSKLFELSIRQGYLKAYAGITLPNEASLAIHQTFGFEKRSMYPKVGYKHGKWLDVVWLEKRLGDLPENPNEPIAINCLS